MQRVDSKTTVMIIDDTPANLEVLEEILSQQGYRVAAFPRGEMALRAAAKSHPDLILLDIMMPGMDGFQVCSQLKANETLQDVPIIFISALDDTANKVKAFTHGGIDYVTKPFQEEEVIARVKTHLSLRHMQLQLQRHSNHLEELVREKIKEISNSQMATLVAISNLAEFRDKYTGQHIERTRTFCQLLSKQLQQSPRYAKSIDDRFIDNIYHAATLHDIGKIGIPDSILLKQGKLTYDEFEIMKSHTIIGNATLHKVKEMYPKNAFINMGLAMTRSHHEKWNGSGYPDGLAGEDIPLSARIMALVDVYDALRSLRPYKEPFTHEQSIEIILKDTGQHFDSAIVDAFMAIEPSFSAIFNQMNDCGAARGELA